MLSTLPIAFALLISMVADARARALELLVPTYARAMEIAALDMLAMEYALAMNGGDLLTVLRDAQDSSPRTTECQLVTGSEFVPMQDLASAVAIERVSIALNACLDSLVLTVILNVKEVMTTLAMDMVTVPLELLEAVNAIAMMVGKDQPATNVIETLLDWQSPWQSLHWL